LRSNNSIHWSSPSPYNIRVTEIRREELDRRFGRARVMVLAEGDWDADKLATEDHKERFIIILTLAEGIIW